MLEVDWIYACVISRCIISNFVLSDLAIFLYLDAVYWGSWLSTSLFIYLSIKKHMSDRNIMWTYSCCFLSCLQSHWTSAKGAKGADIGDSWVRNACTRDTCTKNAFIISVGTEAPCIGDIYMESACIWGIYLCDAYIRSVSTLRACITSTCNNAIEHLEIHLQLSWILEVG